MPRPQEYSIDLTAQELLEVPVLEQFTEIEDIGAPDLLELAANVANADRPSPVSCNADDSVEIELSAQEIDALLNALPKA